jgi:diguanylate cyclase (GGDEF)-like protein
VSFDDDIPQTGSISAEEIQRLAEMAAAKRRTASVLALSGTRLGRLYTVTAEPLVIGRSPECAVHLPEEGVSRRHAQIEWRDHDVWLKDLDSTNGTFVNGVLAGEHCLQDGDRIQVGVTTLLRFAWQDELEQQFQQHQYDSATRDGLTGLYSKKYLLESLATEVAFAHRHGRIVSLAIIDADHFKRVNDTWGHLAGDHVLQQLSSIMQACVRRDDVLARYGGEEFCVIMRDVPAENGSILAERIRQRVELTPFLWQGERLPVTVSIGVACGPTSSVTTPEDLIAAADRYLYEAKHAGRNRVVVQPA